jgi:predicted Rossmann-fold nucleotide-binding protein
MYWRALLRQLEQMLNADAVEPDELELLLVTDDLNEAIAHIRRHAIDAFGLRARPRSSGVRGLGGWLRPRKPIDG